MSANTYTDAEMSTAGVTNLKQLTRLLKAVPYTNVRELSCRADVWKCEVDETVTHADMLTAITAASIPVAVGVDDATPSLVADGVATKAINVTGVANAVVDLVYGSSLIIDVTQVTLDGSGGGSVTVGPYPSGHKTTQGVAIQFKYADDRAASAQAVLSIT